MKAETLDRKGFQSAAMLWAKGANSIQHTLRVSEVGDAYGLATGDFSRVLVTGKEPKAIDLSLSSGQRINPWLGGKPKYAACDAFGRRSGLIDAFASKYGAAELDRQAADARRACEDMSRRLSPKSEWSQGTTSNQPTL